MQMATQMAMPALLPAAVPVAALAEAGGAGVEVPKVESAKSKYLEVKSPMVGTYYGAPEPGAKPYLSVGDRITKGEIVCIIEAMKIMNEIESEFRRSGEGDSRAERASGRIRTGPPPHRSQCLTNQSR